MCQVKNTSANIEYIMETLDLLTASASDIQILLSSGRITSVELVARCLAQIERYDRNGWELRAMMFISNREKLMDVARSLDQERTAGKVRGRLHGVPIVLKDQWQLHPDYGMPTTAGMSALLEAQNSDSAALVKKVL